MTDEPEILIVDYRAQWPNEFAALADNIRSIVGPQATRIDHIGSTSIPGLAAKDVIDVQISVASLQSQTLTSLLDEAGFHWVRGTRDLLVGLTDTSPELDKEFLRQPQGMRRAHIHVREEGRLNQQYPLLFRDYLRSDATARAAYQNVKQVLAGYFPKDKDAYYAIKDPYMDTVYLAAKLWAQTKGWQPDTDFR